MLTDEEKDLRSTLSNNLMQIPPQQDKKKRQVFIVLGSIGAGKTAIFESQTQQLEHIQTTSQTEIDFNTWFDGKSIYLELPEAIYRNNRLLSVYLKSLRKYRKDASVNGLLLCLNVYSAISKSPKSFVIFLKRIAKQLNQICQHFKSPTRLHVVFTHMDTIAGFCHSFTELESAWGYSFKPYNNHAAVLKQNQKLFGHLLKNLHVNLLEKLHATDDKLTKYLVREFPLQMESISNLVNACINHLSIESLITTAVYFTSAKQSNSAHDRLTPNISQAYSLNLPSQVPQSSLDKVYFITGMLQQLGSYAALKPAKKYDFNVKIVGMIAASIFICSGTYHIYNQYHLNSAYEEFFFFQHTPKDSMDGLIPALEHLSNANVSVSNMQGLISLNHISSLTNQIKNEYQNTIKGAFLPWLAREVENQLGASKSPAQIYSALKVYLMLSNADYLEQDYLLEWFQVQWKKGKVPHQDKLKKLLIESTAKPFITIKIDQSIIDSARNYLKALPRSFLYFNLIEDHLPKSTTALKLKAFNIEQINVPYIFQKANVAHIYQTVLPKLITQFRSDNYVLQDRAEGILTTVQNAYLKNYENFWSRIANKVQPTTFNNYREGSHFFSNLASTNSPIENIFHILQKNTSAFQSTHDKLERTFNKLIASKFTSANLISQYQLNQLKPLFADISHYLKVLNSDNDPQQAAFNIAKQRFMHNSQDAISRVFNLENQLPYPLNAWTKNVATNAWFLILQDAQAHINEKWQNFLYPFYKNKINNHFPFSKDEVKEVSLQDFTEFFNPQGKLNQFFNFYLAPFIDLSSAKWQTKIKDELALPIHKNTIKELIRANVIRAMFFKDNDKLPSVKFTLHALALEPVVDTVTIDINGQSLVETQNEKRSKEFSWPHQFHRASTRLTVKNITGKSFEVAETGEWGWFKLLNKANMQPYNNDMTNFELILDLNGAASKFLMVTESKLNPFIPDVLTNFTLPDSIT